MYFMNKWIVTLNYESKNPILITSELVKLIYNRFWITFTTGVSLSQEDLSITPLRTAPQRNNNATYPPDLSAYKPEEDDSALYDDARNTDTPQDLLITEYCQNCKKGYRFMDQSFESLGDRTVGYCHCTMSEDFVFGGADDRYRKKTNGNQSIASVSSGFYSQPGTFVPFYNQKDLNPVRPNRMRLLP